MMIVYNIRRAQYSKQISASGVANRWNKKDEFVLYTGSSVSLAALELIAHRNSIQTSEVYKLLFIEIKFTSKDITTIDIKTLPTNWKSIHSYPVLQQIGSKWYQNKKSLLMEVPSVLVPQEKNYLINTKHPAFKEKVRLIKAEDFTWDFRLLNE